MTEFIYNWVARDNTGNDLDEELRLFTDKPTKREDGRFVIEKGESWAIDENLANGIFITVPHGVCIELPRPVNKRGWGGPARVRRFNNPETTADKQEVDTFIIRRYSAGEVLELLRGEVPDLIPTRYPIVKVRRPDGSIDALSAISHRLPVRDTLVASVKAALADYGTYGNKVHFYVHSLTLRFDGGKLAMYLRYAAVQQPHSDAQHKAVTQNGRTAAMVRLQEFVRARAPGSCKRLSSGADCACPLCDLDRLFDTHP